MAAGFFFLFEATNQLDFKTLDVFYIRLQFYFLISSNLEESLLQTFSFFFCFNCLDSFNFEVFQRKAPWYRRK